MFGWRKNKKDEEVKEPTLSGDRFADMENELQTSNPERKKELVESKSKYNPSIKEDKAEPRLPVYPSGYPNQKPKVFSNGRDFSRRLSGFQNDEDEESHSNSENLINENIKNSESKNPRNQISKHNLDNTITEVKSKAINGYLVSIAETEEDFQKFCRGDKSVLKIIPVLAETPEKAANYVESQNKIPVEAYDYNFFKDQVEKIEKLARDNGINILRK